MMTWEWIIISKMTKKSSSLEETIYKLGKWCLIPITVLGVWFSRWGYHYTNEITRCSFREQTGLPCAGCGGTRAVILLFRGHFLGSFCYHPAVLTAVILYIHFMIYYLYRKKWSKKTYEREIPVQIYAYILVVVILLQWIIKLVIIFHYAG